MVTQICSHQLYVSNITQSLKFYMNILGMHLVKHEFKDAHKHYFLSFDVDSKQAYLELICDTSNKNADLNVQSSITTGYWKMAISVQDVQLARQKLIKNNIEVSSAVQVPNVAYLCHFSDPDGHALELIQHTFEENFVPKEEDSSYALGNKPTFLLITYRSKNIEKSIDFYKNTLGMRLLSKMDVSQRGFDLYFFGYTKKQLPNEDICSVDNVQWLWQRNCTMIELQHIHEFSKNDSFEYEIGSQTGFKGITVESNTAQTLYDPDGYTIECLTACH